MYHGSVEVVHHRWSTVYDGHTFRGSLVRHVAVDNAIRLLACRYWDLFDTWSLTKPVGWDNLLVSMEKVDGVLVDARVDEQVELLRSHMDLVGRKITKVAVESALLKLRQSAVFAGLVAHRLSLQ